MELFSLSVERWSKDRLNAMRTEIESFTDDQVVNTPADALVDYLKGKYGMDVPVVREADKRIEFIGEARGSQVQDAVVIVPFDGEMGVFTLKGSSHPWIQREVELREGELRLHVR